MTTSILDMMSDITGDRKTGGDFILGLMGALGGNAASGMSANTEENYMTQADIKERDRDEANRKILSGEEEWDGEASENFHKKYGERPIDRWKYRQYADHLMYQVNRKAINPDYDPEKSSWYDPILKMKPMVFLGETKYRLGWDLNEIYNKQAKWWAETANKYLGTKFKPNYSILGEDTTLSTAEEEKEKYTQKKHNEYIDELSKSRGRFGYDENYNPKVEPEGFTKQEKEYQPESFYGYNGIKGTAINYGQNVLSLGQFALNVVPGAPQVAKPLTWAGTKIVGKGLTALGGKIAPNATAGWKLMGKGFRGLSSLGTTFGTYSTDMALQQQARKSFTPISNNVVDINYADNIIKTHGKNYMETAFKGGYEYGSK